MEDRFLPDSAEYPILHLSILRRPVHQDWHLPPSWFGKIIDSVPFSGAVHIKRFAENRDGRETSCAVAVPVRNERRLLPRCLSGLLASAEQLAEPPAFVFVVHDTSDLSYQIICDWLFENNLAGTVLDLGMARQIRNAPHARRLALDIAAQLCPLGTLLTTDADSCVGTEWCRQSVTRIDSGCDLVCEDIMLFDDELAQLPEQVRWVGDAERAYFELSDRLWKKWTGGAYEAFAHRASGASMAFRSAIYSELGGLPLPPVGEDAAFCAAVVDAGHNVVTLPNFGTRTSARIHARASGGCGQALSERSRMSDAICDAALVPVSQLRRRASATLAAMNAGVVRTRSAGSGEIQPCRSLSYSELLIELEQGRTLLSKGDQSFVG